VIRSGNYDLLPSVDQLFRLDLDVLELGYGADRPALAFGLLLQLAGKLGGTGDWTTSPAGDVATDVDLLEGLAPGPVGGVPAGERSAQGRVSVPSSS
jgi:hypothetical protein